MRSLLCGRRPAMAAPSSSHIHIPSPRLDPYCFADSVLRSGVRSPSQQPLCSETPWSMAPDRDREAFLRPCVEGGRSTLREHEAALSVLERMDECWLFGNVLKSSRGSQTSALPQEDVSPSLPAFKSIELVNPELLLSDFLETGRDSNAYREFPRACFDLSPRCRETEGSNEGVQEANRCGDGIIQQEQHHGSSELLVGAEDERIVEAAEATGLQESEFLKDLKQAEETLQANPSFAKDQINTTNLTGSRLDAVEQRKKVPIPLPSNNMNVGLSRKARRRRERKKKARGTEHFEHDEMKGFKELGFSFSQDKLTPRLIGLFPSIKVNHGEGKGDPKVSVVASPHYKLYTSPAWWATKPSSPFYNWQCPDPHQEGVDMKAALKSWARAVALTVRQKS